MVPTTPKHVPGQATEKRLPNQLFETNSVVGENFKEKPMTMGHTKSHRKKIPETL